MTLNVPPRSSKVVEPDMRRCAEGIVALDGAGEASELPGRI